MLAITLLTSVLTLTQGYESLPSYRATEIVPAELRESDDYRVADIVRNDGYWNLYEIESEYLSFSLPAIRCCGSGRGRSRPSRS